MPKGVSKAAKLKKEALVVEVTVYGNVDILNYWGHWTPQHIVISEFLGDWIVVHHWYSTNSKGDEFSQLDSPLIVPKGRVRVSTEKAKRALPWDWYKGTEDFVKFCQSRVDGIGKPRRLDEIEKSVYGVKK
jgi:hypothetical protein